MTTGRLPVAIVSALPEELSALRSRLRGDRRFVLAVAGAGPVRAERALADLLDRKLVAGVIGIGVAGALTSNLAVGDLVVARDVRDGSRRIEAPEARWIAAAESAGAIACTCVSVATILATEGDKLSLAEEIASATAVVDCESATWGRVAAAHGLPFAVLRVVSDGWDESLPTILHGCQRTDGSLDRVRIVLRALARPSEMPWLYRLRRRMRKASIRLSQGVEAMVISPEFLHFFRTEASGRVKTA